MSSLHQVDELVKEYLLFRGFTNSYRALESESRSDKDKGFQVEKILEDLLGYIANSDVQKLIDYYRYLDLRFFSRLDSRFQRTVKKFELCLLRHYLVYAMQHKRRDKVIEFFDTYGSELYGKAEWSQWFALPYIKNPASDPAFETYFTKQWTDNYTVSLHNFLSTTFRHMPLPSLLSFNMDRVQRKAQQGEIEALKSQIEALKAAAEVRENEIAKLKHEIAETRREVTDGISLIRRRAASLTREPKSNGSGDTKPPQIDKAAPDNSLSVVSEDPGGIEEEPFLLVSQDEYAEHASAITHAKFSSQGNLIASCDMDNIVRIWSYKGQSMNPLKINNNTCNILSMEWEARSDRFLFLGTDVGTIRIYNVESKAIVQEFQMESGYPWVNQILCSPVEPILVCAGSENKLSVKDRMGILVTWSMKSMAATGTFRYHTKDDTFADINTINLNHNGQMLVAGDNAGYMRIFDVRSMKSIMEWKHETGKPFCKAQFSFDETSIYSVDHSGQLSKWSIHKPGTNLRTDCMNGFPPPPAYSAPSQQPTDSNTLTNERGHLRKSSSTTTSANAPPRPTSNPSTTSISRLSVSSGRSNRLPTITFDDSVTQFLLSVSPRPEMVTFSSDTEFCLCASWSPSHNTPVAAAANSTSSFDTSNAATTQGSIYRVADGKISFQFGHQPAHQSLTAVDWTNSSNACLLGSVDGVIKVTNLIKV